MTNYKNIGVDNSTAGGCGTHYKMVEVVRTVSNSDASIMSRELTEARTYCTCCCGLTYICARVVFLHCAYKVSWSAVPVSVHALTARNNSMLFFANAKSSPMKEETVHETNYWGRHIRRVLSHPPYQCDLRDARTNSKTAKPSTNNTPTRIPLRTTSHATVQRSLAVTVLQVDVGPALQAARHKGHVLRRWVANRIRSV